MPAGAIGAIGSFIGSLGASAGVATGIATGMVYGAAIGGVSAAISGDNILEGMFKGGAIGGVTGGIGNVLSSGAKAAATAAEAGASASGVTSTGGLEGTMFAAESAGTGLTTGGLEGTMFAGDVGGNIINAAPAAELVNGSSINNPGLSMFQKNAGLLKQTNPTKGEMFDKLIHGATNMSEGSGAFWGHTVGELGQGLMGKMSADAQREAEELAYQRSRKHISPEVGTALNRVSAPRLVSAPLSYREKLLARGQA